MFLFWTESPNGYEVLNISLNITTLILLALFYIWSSFYNFPCAFVPYVSTNGVLTLSPEGQLFKSLIYNQLMKSIYPLFGKMCSRIPTFHQNGVNMGAIGCQITSLTIVYSTVYSNADRRKHQSYASPASVRGIHRWPVNSPHKWPVTRKMFPFDDVIMWNDVSIFVGWHLHIPINNWTPNKKNTMIPFILEICKPIRSLHGILLMFNGSLGANGHFIASPSFRLKPFRC